MDEQIMEQTIGGDDLMLETFDLSEHLVSAEKVANNIDLLNMILLQVPAKSLVRFKCVSKDWLSLISGSKFCNEHTSKNSYLSILGFYIDSRPLVNLKTEVRDAQPSLPELHFLTTPSGVKAKILDSRNGLMLCKRGRELIVCNLTTQKFNVVSPLSGLSWDYADKFLYFNPMESSHFKLVIIHIECTTSRDHIGTFISGYSYYINIYSSESGIWKKLCFSKPDLDPFSEKVLCDGAIYWIAGPINLMRFDINAENLETIPLPPGFAVFGENTVSWLGEYAGNLFLVIEASCKLQIVEMDMHHSQWNIKHNTDRGMIIDTTYFREAFGFDYNCNVYLLMGGDKETPTLLFAGSGKIMSYNPKSNYVNEITQDFPCDVCGIIKLSPGRIRARKFIASLAAI